MSAKFVFLLLLAVHQPLTVVELFARRQEKLSEKEDKIAELASGLVEDPETNVKLIYYYNYINIENYFPFFLWIDFLS